MTTNTHFTQLTDLPVPEVPEPRRARRQLKDTRSPAAVREWVPTEWPMIGGASLSLEPECRFSSPDLIERFVPGERCAVYIAGCMGLRVAIGQALNIGAWKVSTSQIEAQGLEPRMKALGRDRYGSRYRSSDRLVEDPGFDKWVLATLPPDLVLSPDSPLRLRTRGIEVILPSDLDPGKFDRMLRDALVHAELWAWASSLEGQTHCAYFNLSPSRFRRFTAYDMCGADRVSPAREIYLFKPHLQSQRLVRIVETIVADHVLRC